MRDFEHYNRLIKETKLRIYYASTMGKVGYVIKKEIDGKDIRDDLIKWVKPKPQKTHGSVKMRVAIGGNQVCLKKVIARAFIAGYDEVLYSLKHKNGNYRDCSLRNLYMANRHEELSKAMAKKKSKEVEVGKNGSYKRYPTMTLAARNLNVDVTTLSKYTRGITKKSALDIYEFRINGVLLPTSK